MTFGAALVAALSFAPIVGHGAGSAYAAPATIGTCTFVENPTPTNHTECPGADLRPQIGVVPGLDLRYANLAGADLTGSPLFYLAADARDVVLDGAKLDGAPLDSLDLTGSSIRGVNLQSGYMGDAVLVDVDFTGSTFGGGAVLRDSNLTGANLTDVTFEDGAVGSGIKLPGAQVTRALLPANLSGGVFTGVDFSEAQPLRAGSDFRGADLVDAAFTNVAFDGVDFGGADMLRASFVGVTFAAGSALQAGGVNLNSADLSGVDFSPLGTQWLNGSILAYADLSGATLKVWPGGYFPHADLSGAALFGDASGAVFHDANLDGAAVLHGDDPSQPMNFGGAEFHRASLTGADLNNTNLDGAVFVDANLRGADLQSSALHGFGGVVFIGTDLTDAKLPPAMHTNGWAPEKWPYGFYLHDSIIDGTSLVGGPVAATATGSAPTAVTYPLPAAWANTDGKLPYGPSYDGDYWYGAKYTCDHESGDLFPVGETVVNCDVTIDHISGIVPWQQPDELDLATGRLFDDTTDWDATADYQGSRMEKLVEPAAPAIAKGAGMTIGTSFDVEPYKYRPMYVPTTGGGIFTRSSASFVVTVNSAPTVSGSIHDGVAGELYAPAALTSDGFPAPVATIKTGALPAGLTLSPSGVVSGTPAVGSGGLYSLVVEVMNSTDSDELALTMRIIEPVVDVVDDGTIEVGDQVTVNGSGFTPNSDVEVWQHSTPELVETVRASSTGTVSLSVRQASAGQHHFELVDVTTAAVGVSDPYNVRGAATLASTGADYAFHIASALLLLGLGVLAIVDSRRRRSRRPVE